MYQKEEIERLAKKYVETQEEEVFEALIKALIPLIDAQLGKNYSRLKQFWDDLRQEVLLKLHKNRGGLSTTKSINFCTHFYRRIRVHLWRAAQQLQGKRKDKKIKMGYDGLSSEVTYLEDLSMEEKKKLGIEPSDESYD